MNPAPVSKKVCVIGSGYVGLTTAVCFAHLGHDVTCTDIDADRVARLSAGECPILEHGLPELLAEGLASGRLDFSTDNGAAAAAAEFTYLCVPTPQGDDGSADLSYIQAAATEIGPHVEAGSVVVNKSTVPVGSTLVVERALGRSDVFVVSNPEFLREGTAVHDFLHPDRMVVGADDRSAAMRVAELYDGIGATLIITDPPSAETIKYAANAFLATKLSFVNAVAAVCEAVGADMNDVVVGIGTTAASATSSSSPAQAGVVPASSATRRCSSAGTDGCGTCGSTSSSPRWSAQGPTGGRCSPGSPGQPSPELHAVSRFTARPYDGDVVDDHHEDGPSPHRHRRPPDGRVRRHRRARVDGRGGRRPAPRPLAARRPGRPARCSTTRPTPGSAGSSTPASRLASHRSRSSSASTTSSASCWPSGARQLPAARRHDATRSGTLRLSELHDLGIPTLRGRFGTATNGTYVPDAVPFDEPFWRMVGLYLAEGHVAADGARRRVCWSFAPVGEDDWSRRSPATGAASGSRSPCAGRPPR